MTAFFIIMIFLVLSFVYIQMGIQTGDTNKSSFNKKIINKDIAKLEKRKHQSKLLDEKKKKREKANEDYNKKRKVMCDDGVERYWWYNRRNIIIDTKTLITDFLIGWTEGFNDEEGEVKIKEVKKITPNKEVFDSPFDRVIPIIKWFNNKGKTMNLKEIIKYNKYEYDKRNFHFNRPLPRKRYLKLINGYAIGASSFGASTGDMFFPFSGTIDKSQYIEGVLKNKKSKKKSDLPNWFYGDIRKRGATATNIYTNKEYKLNASELSMYDFIKGCEMMIQIKGGPFNKKSNKFEIEMTKGLDWFRENNPKAFKILFDEV